MAGLRLLTLLLSCVLASASFGCALGPIYARRVEGQVIDKRNGQPVQDALAFVVYEIEQGNDRYTVDTRWDHTDAQGRFAIPGHFSMTLYLSPSHTDRKFFMRVVHPEFGLFTRGNAQEIGSFGYDFLFEIEPTPLRRLFEHPREWASLCSGLGKEGCDEMCTYAYGSLEACYGRGRPRPK